MNDVLPLLMDRLQNEITRVHAMKAISAIARSPRHVDISIILPDCVQMLSQLLRQQSRTLKLAALDALNDLVLHKGSRISQSLLCECVVEVSSLISDGDLQLCRMGIVLLSNTLKVNPSVATEPALLQRALPDLLVLSRSPLLQGPTLDALKALFG